ncbi:hypothetical protein CBR_g48855 [Chara braunii]|uniref:Uncharacterized protein n=1 Tax=Chara braunii TaxID=69332 RepID=A0A388M3I0_CHABU|nr:hypothetical protein CBR_g48855 [Chara braunii]|eukprot:GBG89148.1 hypothetical protein CBR_g48855 [Chara braunii]
MMAMQAAIMQDEVAAALLEEEEAPLEVVRMHKRQIEELYEVLTHHQQDLSAELLDEGEEVLNGWDEEIRAHFSLQRLGITERAQVTAEMGDCAEMIRKLRGVFVKLWEGLHVKTTCGGSQQGSCVGLVEGQVPGATTRDRLHAIDDVGVPIALSNNELGISREEPEERQVCCGELEARLLVDVEECSRGGGGIAVLCDDNNSNNNNNNGELHFCVDRGDENNNNNINNNNNSNNNNNNDNRTGIEGDWCGEGVDNKIANENNISGDDCSNNNNIGNHYNTGEEGELRACFYGGQVVSNGSDSIDFGRGMPVAICGRGELLGGGSSLGMFTMIRGPSTVRNVILLRSWDPGGVGW